jgi:hypothetical protein
MLNFDLVNAVLKGVQPKKPPSGVTTKAFGKLKDTFRKE